MAAMEARREQQKKESLLKIEKEALSRQNEREKRKQIRQEAAASI